ncbi:peroxiredoxin [Solimonas sp. K1W22B-7]|uniref:peroxiredoxin n=1 Tax=Solimonas sp. K1W22B-7 TaxID=2303331 RepID=UPI000E332E7C|nr:peroxiredoxin [Solimonas sp. K1W22B-7]AXQ28472.1 peroxiredoxin [Solimonas sp. K1W22B-7]
MKKLWMMLMLAASCCLPAQAALSPGDAAPEFKTRAALDGKAFDYSLREALQKGPVVVYFYPSAYTNGCNVQAHTFAESLGDFAAAGTSVVGVSLDDIGRLESFSADPQYCAGKLPVASDGNGDIARAYGLEVREAAPGKKDTRGADILHGRAERTSFLIDTDGKIVATIGGLSPVDNVAKALEQARALATTKKPKKK